MLREFVDLQRLLDTRLDFIVGELAFILSSVLVVLVAADWALGPAALVTNVVGSTLLNLG